MDYKNIFKILCHSCTGSRCHYTRQKTTHFFQGCYPWDCIYTKSEEAKKYILDDSHATIEKCPFASAADFKGGLFGCPKYNKDEKGTFCPYGVRAVRVLGPDRSDRDDEDTANNYEFYALADLYYNHQHYFTENTPLEEACKRLDIKCVRELAERLSPDAIRDYPGMTQGMVERVFQHMSVFGYTESDGKWRKRTVDEQHDWVERLRLERTKELNATKKEGK